MDRKAHTAVCPPTPDSPVMEFAMANARASFKYLWRELTWEYRRIVPALELSAVKAAFNDPGGDPAGIEHMWLSNIRFDGDVIVATLLNSPHGLRLLKEGEEIALRLEHLEDWMYVLSGRVYGGFTIQALRAAMSRAERKGHDSAWGFEFPEPEKVNLAPDWKNTKRPSVLGRLLKYTPPPPNPDEEHPMSINMAADGLAEAIEENPEGYLRQCDESGLNTLHSLALGGSVACVKVLLEKGADPHVKTKSGHTARALAEAMGWGEVANLLKASELSQ